MTHRGPKCDIGPRVSRLKSFPRVVTQVAEVVSTHATQAAGVRAMNKAYKTSPGGWNLIPSLLRPCITYPILQVHNIFLWVVTHMASYH